MPADLSAIDKAKFVAALRAVDHVESGMKLGLGTGSTAAWMVRCLAERIRDEGLRVVGVPTSIRTASGNRPESWCGRTTLTSVTHVRPRFRPTGS